MDSKLSVIEQWLEKVIIGQNICPFAKDQWKRGEIKTFFFEGHDHEAAFNFTHQKIEEFLKYKGHSFLVAFPEFRDNFIQFYNFSALIEDEVRHLGLEKRVQVVTFHPKFRFEGEKSSARGNYVNKSPYPLLHFLDFDDVKVITEKFGVNIGSEVSHNNNQKLNDFTAQEFREKIGQYIDDFWPLDGES